MNLRLMKVDGLRFLLVGKKEGFWVRWLLFYFCFALEIIV